MRLARLLGVIIAALFLTGAPAGAAGRIKQDILINKPSMGTQLKAVPIPGPLNVSVVVVNDGKATVKRSKTGIYLSQDAKPSSSDIRLGRIATPKLKQRKQAKVKGSFRLAKAGTFRLIACADDAHKIHERKEGNNCKAATASLTVTAAASVTPTPTATPTATATVAPPTAPANTALPAITGATAVGSVLNIAPGAWTGTAPITYSYVWRRDGAPIAGSTGTSYALTLADTDHAISVSETATNAAGAASADSTGLAVPGVPQLAGCQLFPPDYAYNTDISDVTPITDPDYLAKMHPTTALHADFNKSDGYEFDVVPATQAGVTVTFGTAGDTGSYPIPDDATINDGDNDVLVLQQGTCLLSELYQAAHGSGSWTADVGGRFDTTSSALRPDGSAAAAGSGLPILPGLVRHDEIAAGVIRHALLFTMNDTQNRFVHPATYAIGTPDATLPPFGLRLRLKAGVDISQASPAAQVILKALKKYGMYLADGGSDFHIQGEQSPDWTNVEEDGIALALGAVHGSDFQVMPTGTLHENR